MKDAIIAARSENPAIQIKVNTVVNAQNFQEDLSDFIETIAPAKWKVFRAIPTTTEALSISEDEFASFVMRHAHF